MVDYRKIGCFFVGLLYLSTAYSQTPQFSLGTDFSLQRSLKKGQQYWAIGQTVIGQFNFSRKDAAYGWLCYYTDGEFTDIVNATAKSSLIIPQSISYMNTSSMSFKQISLGWKHYLIGVCDSEDKINLYMSIGLGLMLGVVNNTQDVAIDTFQYNMPVLPGKANFKRLTYDFGLGLEKPIGGDVYLYLEGKTFVPSTDYPSDHLLVNKDAPLTVYLNLGVRVLFN